MSDDPGHPELASTAPLHPSGATGRGLQPLEGHSQPLSVGRELLQGRFRLRRELGAGGMGVVFEAEDRRDDLVVALKTLRAPKPELLLRLKKEFRSLQDMDHPHLVSLGELFEDCGHWFFTMELVDGVDFIEHVRGASLTASNTTIDPLDLPFAPTGADLAASTVASDPSAATPSFWPDEGRLRQAVGQLAEGLNALHAAGKVHRDIKPSNVLVEQPSERVVVLDFGLVTDASEQDTSLGSSLAGTLRYMAPEQATGGVVGPPADWYSVGVMLYQSLCARLPFIGPPSELTRLKLEAAVEPPRGFGGSVAADLEQLCLELLQPDPARRPDGPAVLRRIGRQRLEPDSSMSGAQTAPAPQERAAAFVGRERELAALHGAFERSQGGETTAVWLSGESGVGKTSLLQRFRDDLAAHAARPVVLWGRCNERESVPYKALDGVIDCLCEPLARLSPSELQQVLPADAELLRRSFPVLGRVSAIATAPTLASGMPGELRGRLGAALRLLLAGLASRHPLVICIDDAQWADADSAELVHQLIRGPSVGSLLLLFCSQTNAPSSDSEAAAALSPDSVSASEHHTLGPLEADAAQTLAAQLLRDSPSATRAHAHRVASEARGHPLYIAELARHLELHQQTDGSGPLPTGGLSEAIRTRFDQLPAQARRIAELVALSACPLPQGLIAAAAELPSGLVSQQTRRLAGAHFLRRSGSPDSPLIGSYHERVRRTVLQTMSAETRRSLHGRLALELERTVIATDRPDVLLWHLEAAQQQARAASYAAAAARRASAALAFDRAAELYRAALRLGQQEGDSARELQLELATACSNAGRGLEAADSFLRAAEGAEPVAALQRRCRAAEHLLTAGYVERGVALSEEILAELGSPLPQGTASTLKALLWARGRLRLTGLRWRGRRKPVAAARAAQLEAHTCIARGLGLVDTLRGALCQTHALLLALEIGEPEAIGRALAYEAALLASGGERSRARATRVRNAAAEVADQIADPHLQAWVATTDACLCYFGCRYERAEQLLVEAERAFGQQLGTIFELNGARSLRLHVAREAGELARLRQLYERYIDDAQRRGDRYADTTVRRVAHLCWLADDNPQGALGDLAQATWVPPGDSFHLQHWYELRARGDVALYQRSVAGEFETLTAGLARLRRSALIRVEPVQSAGLWLEGRLLLAGFGVVADSASVRRRVPRLVRRLLRQKTPRARVYADLLRAGLSARVGQRDQAARALHSAAELAEHHGCQLHAATARFWLARWTNAQGSVRAERWMQDQGIRRPAALATALAPGLSVDAEAESTRRR